jgi:hypothetical protein
MTTSQDSIKAASSRFRLPIINPEAGNTAIQKAASAINVIKSFRMTGILPSSGRKGDAITVNIGPVLASKLRALGVGSDPGALAFLIAS